MVCLKALLERSRIKQPLHVFVKKGVYLGEARQDIPLAKRKQAPLETFSPAGHAGDRMRHVIGNKLRQPAIIRRQLHTFIAVISSPGLVGALSAQSYFDAFA